MKSEKLYAKVLNETQVKKKLIWGFKFTNLTNPKLFPSDMLFYSCHSLLGNRLNFKCLTLILTWGSARVINPPCKIYTQQPVVNNGVLTYWQRRDGFARGFHGEAPVFHFSFTPPRSARSSCTSHRRSPLSCPPLCGSGAGLRVTAPAPAAFTARRTHGECAPRGWKWEVALRRGTELPL